MHIIDAFKFIASRIIDAPLETLAPRESEASSNFVEKTVACSAAGVFTLFSGGYYLIHANEFFTNRKIANQVEQLDRLMKRSNVNEKEVVELFKKIPAMKLPLLLNGTLFGTRPYFLPYAAEGNLFEVVKFLVEAGGDVNLEGRAGTPLKAAIASGNIEMVKFLLEEMRANPNLGQYQRTAIAVAATEDLDGKTQLEVLKLLIKNKAELNPVGRRSPLFWVANNDNMQRFPKETREMVLLLLKNGAKIPQDQRDIYANAVKFIEQANQQAT